MNCKICGSENTRIEYRGKLRMNLVPVLDTNEDIDVWKCDNCDVIWHTYDIPKDYYQSEEYRKHIDIETDIETHYRKYDKNVLEKLNWTGSDIYRHKIVADIGCAGGCFIDFLHSVANETIGIEPSAIFRKGLEQKGYKVFAYPKDALSEYKNKIDVITSFDVIEHVDDPKAWVSELYELLRGGGSKIIVGTPTDYPVLRKLIGKEFERIIFQIHHPWIFSEKSLQNIFLSCGFKNVKIKQTYHFGIGNVINWLKEGTAKGDIKFDYFSDTLNEVWRNEMIAKGLGEYLVVYAEKW
jgi:2-polyprenyl-3-methyl-5-hydroxy-6-metoxy-1,4-benzoquinol methylase